MPKKLLIPTPRKIKRYGWIPSLPDIRDEQFRFVPDTTVSLPSAVDNSKWMPQEVYDQGELGSCSANAGAEMVKYEEARQGLTSIEPSRLFLYYNERKIEGTVNTDSGARIRDCLKTLNQQGVCPESECPYDITKFKLKPTAKCYQDALSHRVTKYQPVTQDLNHLKAVLAAGGAIEFGFTVYSSFESEEVAKTGIVPMPTPQDSVEGGHAVMTFRYDDAKQAFMCRNSWGGGWGINGNFWLPYAYITNPRLAADCWTIQMIQS